MSTGFGDSLALPLRRRLDLQFRRLQFGEESSWGVKDPVRLQYFQLRDEEYELLQLLDGEISAAELRSRFERRFPGRRLSYVELHHFLGALHRDGLIISETPGQGPKLWRRRTAQVWREWGSRLTNLLAIQLPGINPSRFLDWLVPRCEWLFSPIVLMAAAISVMAAAGLAVIESREIQARLPEFNEFFSTGNLLGLFAALALVKMLHELGHAVTCRHFGQECHEMGLMLFVFTPTLYCNVSDAWMLPEKRARLAISAAGVIVELVLAAQCTALWWFSVPGAFNLFCLNLMVVCSVQTLLFNANPLLRYDGYFFLADLVEIPNLKDQASLALRQLTTRWLFGVEPVTPFSRARGGWLAAYAAAGAIYRLSLAVGIVWFIRRLLEPQRLELLADLLAVGVVSGIVFSMVSFGRQVVSEARASRDEFDWTRGVRRSIIAICLLAFFLFIPLPRRVAAPGILEPAGAQRVYAANTGRLVYALAAGSNVKPGDTVVRLENLQLQGELAQVVGERDRQKLHLANLERRRGDDPQVESQLPSAAAALADLDERVKRRQADVAELIVSAPATGRLFPPPAVVDSPAESEGLLESRRGTPLDPSNLGCTLETGTLCGLVGDPERLEAVLIVDETDVAVIEPGQRVHLWMPQPDDAYLSGRVLDIAANDLKILPREFGAGPELSARTDQRGVLKPQRTSYRVRVAFEGRANLPPGTRVKAKIVVPAESLFQRASQFVQRTFRFR